MSFTKLQKALTAQAEADISKMRTQRAAEYAETQRAITERARQLEEGIIRAAEATAALETQRVHQAAQLSARADILRAKQTELTAACDEAVRQVVAWPAAEARALIQSLIDLIPEEGGIVTAGAAHAMIVRELAAARGLTVAQEEIPGDGGFLFRGTRTELNATIRRLMEELFRRNRANLAAMLYG